MMFGKCFLSRVFLRILCLQVYLVENYFSQFFGTDFYAEVFC